MTFQEAMGRLAVVADAIDQEYPELREITRGARASAQRIRDRLAVDRDLRRADRELAILLLDLAEAAERHVGVQRDMPLEQDGGPPSFATMESVRAQNRGSLGIAGTGVHPFLSGQRYGGAPQPTGAPSFLAGQPIRYSGTPVDLSLHARGVGGAHTLLGDELGAVVSVASQNAIRSITVRTSDNLASRFMAWFMDVFGGPDFDVEVRQPIGTVTVSPFGSGDPARAAMVLTTAALTVLLAAYAVFRACSCPPCRRSA